MKNVLKQICSMILAIVMLINLLPLNVLAAELEAERSNDAEISENVSNEVSATDDITMTDTGMEDAYIVEEIEESRTEYSKEFKLSNGLSVAAIYPYSIHYEKDGQWEDIDNSLRISNTRSGSAYTNTAGVWQITLPQQLSGDRGISISKDGYILNFYMDGELYRPENENVLMEEGATENETDVAEGSVIDQDVTQSEETIAPEEEFILPTEEADVAVDEYQPEGNEYSTEEETTPTEIMIGSDDSVIDVEAATAPATDTNSLTEEIAESVENFSVAEDEATEHTEEADGIVGVADPTENIPMPTEESQPGVEESTDFQESAVLPTEETTLPTENPTASTEDSGESLVESEGSESVPNIDNMLPSVQLMPMQETSVVVEHIDLDTAKSNAEYEEIVLENIASRVRYDDVFENTSIVYDLEADRLKESIVIERYNSNLWGYSYILDVGNMIPVLADTNEIELYDESGDTLIMLMPAPYLVDSAGEYCDDVAVTLVGSDGLYKLTYTLPQQWMSSQDRQWPVILDPIVEADRTRSNILDRTVCSDTTLSHNSGSLTMGYQ